MDGETKAETGKGLGAFGSWEVWHYGQIVGAMFWLNGDGNSEAIKAQVAKTRHLGAFQE